MKPLLLKIKGLNSFYEEQTINFGQIIDKGIFGIFGATGSGKSSIIDAITLALYGKINRYDGKNGNREFININGDNTSIYFQFSIKSGKEDKIYTVFRQFKRDKETGSAKASIARLSINNGDEEQIISDKTSEVSAKLERIIGLNYNDFTRAVVLPQGKFSEFLMLENKDKRNMLERIFGLEKYGTKLSEKINLKKREQEEKVRDLERELNPLENIDLENLHILKNNLSSEEELLSNIKVEIEDINKSLNKLERNINLKDELEQFNKKIENLNKNTDKINSFTEILDKSKKAEILKPYLDELNKLENNVLYMKNEIKLKESENTALASSYEKALNNYNIAKNEKSEKEPTLNETKVKLEQAILVEKDILEISKDIQNIENNLYTEEQTLINLKNELQNTINSREELVKKLTEIKLFKNNNKIDSSLREKIEQASKLEEDFVKISREISEKELKLNSLKKELSIKECEQKDLTLKINKLSENKQELEIRLKSLSEESSLSGEEISKAEQELFNLKSEFTTANKKQEKLQVLTFENEQKQEKLNLILNEIDNIKNEKICVDERIKEIEFLTKKYKEESLISELVKSLVEGCSCPVCGSKEHPEPAKVIVQEVSTKLEEEKQNLEKNLKDILVKLDEKNYEKTSLETKLQGILENINEQKEYFKNYNIQEENQKIFELEQNILLLKRNLQLYENIKEKIYYFENENSKLEIGLSSVSSDIYNINENILAFQKQKDTLASNFNLIKESLNNFKIELKIDTFVKEYEKIKEAEKQLEVMERDENKIQEDIDKINKKFEEENKKLNSLENYITSFKTSIKEKKLQRDNLKEQIKDFADKQNLMEYLKQINTSISQITKNEQDLFEIVQKLESRYRQSEKDYNTLVSKIDTIEENRLEKQKEFLDKMQENDFSSTLEIKKYFLTKEQQDELNMKIKDFNQKISDYTLNVKRITEILKDEDLNKINENFKNLSERKESLVEAELSKTKIIVQLNMEISKFNESLEIKEKLEKTLKIENKKLDLLIELATLNKGGLFVEYIATNQLKQIVLDAGQRLKDMSGNKFSIELKNTDFIIKDYHNGGITRTPRGLSGGEVFMASLSLALALSSKLQLTNQAPLEVFFLDEGFGTLDNNLLNTVISSLEKLQTQNVGVGIITHVEELKNRILSKILIYYNDNELGAKISII